MRPNLIILAMLIVAAAPCRGDEGGASYRPGGAQVLSLEELLRRAALGPDARILEIEHEREHGRDLYEIEYLDDGGRIRELLIDARTGEVLGEE